MEDKTVELLGSSSEAPLTMITNKRICHLAMCEALRRNGVADPDSYLEDHTVEYRVWFHEEMGASVMITGTAEKTAEETEVQS